MMVDCCRFLALLTILSFTGSAAWADRTAQVVETKRPGDPPAGEANPTGRNRERNAAHRTVDETVERSVLEMVESHLPDIKVLLDQLRDKEPVQYDNAIRNLAKSSRRLQIARNRGDQAFECELHIIQSQSAINLLIAKLKVRDNKQDRDKLLAETRRLEQAEVERAEFELAGLQSRLEKMKQQVTAAEKRLSGKQSDLEGRIKKDFQTYLRKSGRK